LRSPLQATDLSEGIRSASQRSIGVDESTRRGAALVREPAVFTATFHFEHHVQTSQFSFVLAVYSNARFVSALKRERKDINTSSPSQLRLRAVCKGTDGFKLLLLIN